VLTLVGGQLHHIHLLHERPPHRQESSQQERERSWTKVNLSKRDGQGSRVPVRVSNGTVLDLSPGKHNELQVRIIEEFAKIFAPGAALLYLGDTAKKMFYVDAPALASLGVPMTAHEKLPDVVLFDSQRNWLYLIEAATAHGPVTAKRHYELEEFLKDCPAGRVYVSAFLTFADFRKWLREIAWETEVWIAENPTHLIHYNGDEFLGPRSGAELPR
ncbi:MAG: BsuBI/PstI family type II restriction endonuclease, partial [Candidatus Sumerlaeota bacterium]|nr:BsuBI/PstI family type II restriction endonuclease [Candidatus Sumerlaeota bacterium]